MLRRTLPILLTGFLAPSAWASESDLPSVTISSITSNGVCLDAFCSKPDFFARVRLRDANGNQVSCGATSVTEDRIFVFPNETLCNNGGPASVKILRPYTIIVELWDADGPGSPPSTSSGDQADLSSGPGKYAELGPFNSAGATNRTFIINGPDAAVSLTVDTVPVESQFVSGPTVLARRFDPKLGEEMSVAGSFDDPTPVTVTVTEQATGQRLVVAQTVPMMAFNLTWDGRQSPGGPPMPYGTYDLEVTGLGGRPSFQSSLRLSPAPPLTFANFALETPPQLNVRAIHPVVGFTLSDAAEVTMEIEGMSNRGCTGLPIRSESARLGPGRHRLEWDGRDQTGRWVGAGAYCLRLSGIRSADGVAFWASALATFQVEDPTPIFVEVRMNPEVPALNPGQQVSAQARAFDDKGRPRPVNAIRLEATEMQAGGFAFPMIFLGDCRGASSCTVPFPTGFIKGTAALRAEAEDENGEGKMGSGVRLIDLEVPPKGTDIRVSVAATMEGTHIAELSKRRAIDVAFHRSIDFGLEGPSSLAFGAAVGQNIDAILGFNGRGPSLIEANMGATSFWAVAEPAVVAHGNSPENWDKDLCQVVRASWSGTANVNAVLHLLDCRDNASFSHFTAVAVDPRIAWHELHHRPFELYDEYCCDGGYWQRGSDPNVYVSLPECLAYSSNPATCAMITDTSTTAPKTVNFFISDPPVNDVMSSIDGVEQPDDARRVNAQYRTCTNGGC